MGSKESKLTRKQIKAVTLRSGEFGGLTTAETAKEMNITEQAVNSLLRRAEQVLPQIFPLLTKREADVLALLNLGWSNDAIGQKLDLADYTVSKTLKALQDKGRGVADSGAITMQQYASHMDNKIREKF